MMAVLLLSAMFCKSRAVKLLIPFANIEASQDFLGVEAFDQTT
jgi:hypothetical protein